MLRFHTQTGAFRIRGVVNRRFQVGFPFQGLVGNVRLHGNRYGVNHVILAFGGKGDLHLVIGSGLQAAAVSGIPPVPARFLQLRPFAAGERGNIRTAALGSQRCALRRGGLDPDKPAVAVLHVVQNGGGIGHLVAGECRC